MSCQTCDFCQTIEMRVIYKVLKKKKKKKKRLTGLWLRNLRQ